MIKWRFFVPKFVDIEPEVLYLFENVTWTRPVFWDSVNSFCIVYRLRVKHAILYPPSGSVECAKNIAVREKANHCTFCRLSQWKLAAIRPSDIDLLIQLLCVLDRIYTGE